MKKYLFVIALASCISGCYHTDKQTIDSLVAVNQSLVDAKRNIQENNQHIYDQLRRAMEMDRMKTKPYYDKAMQAVRYSDSLVGQIQNLKISLVQEVDGMNKFTDDSLEHVKNKDAVTKANSILISGSEWAKQLKLSIALYRNSMVNLLNGKDENGHNYLALKDTMQLSMGLLTVDIDNAHDKEISWEEYYFAHAPLTADIVTLTRLQVDIRNCEANFMLYLYGNLSSSCGVSYRYGVFFNRYYGGKIVASTEQLDSIDRISFGPPIEASFEIQFVEKGKQVVFSSPNILLTPEMRSEIKKLSRGDKMIIQNVNVKGIPNYFSTSYSGPTIIIE
ncbi:MAG TPA: hypothetical protein VK806_08910 [Bacteroidia bacterium]|jgi:hypothetical protein|nr:hypothetical protein [Bacteroidia bacterium]